MAFNVLDAEVIENDHTEGIETTVLAWNHRMALVASKLSAGIQIGT